MEFRLLGPLEVVDGGQTLALPAGKARALLAALLLRRNTVVSSVRLIDDLWGFDPPDTALNTLQVHVSQLRKALGRGDARSARGILVTRAPGYLLAVEPEQVDLERFERLLAEGRQALGEGEADRAAALLGDALSLWRGPPLADLADEALAQPEIARLDELRLTALEERFEAELQLGSHTALVAELEAAVAEHPLRERLRHQLMLALYRSGRQADALGVYQRTRHDLVEELGIEPSLALQQLEKAILLQDPALEPAQSAALDAAPDAPARPGPPDAPRREVRKTVSVLVAELAYRRDADPETQRRTLDTWFESAQEVLARHGGRAERLLGDALLGVVGIPSVHEDDALRAVRAAVDLREVSVDLEIQIGISTGEVLARESASPELEVGGAVVGDATRLAREAGIGSVALSESTRRLVADAVRVEHLGGDSAGAGWRLVELHAGLPAVRRRLDTALVGREQELAWLRRGVETAVRERRTHLFTVLGPAGIGKSRLAPKLTLQLGQEARGLVGRCLSFGSGSTFWPLAEILRQLDGDDPHGEIARVLGGDEEAHLVASRLAAAGGGPGGARPGRPSF